MDSSKNVELSLKVGDASEPEVFNWRWAPWPSWKVSMLGEPSGEMEIKARKIALAGHVTEGEILGLCDVVPEEETARGGDPERGRLKVCSPAARSFTEESVACVQIAGWLPGRLPSWLASFAVSVRGPLSPRLSLAGTSRRAP